MIAIHVSEMIWCNANHPNNNEILAQHYSCITALQICLLNTCSLFNSDMDEGERGRLGALRYRLLALRELDNARLSCCHVKSQMKFELCLFLGLFWWLDLACYLLQSRIKLIVALQRRTTSLLSIMATYYSVMSFSQTACPWAYCLPV